MKTAWIFNSMRVLVIMSAASLSTALLLTHHVEFLSAVMMGLMFGLLLIHHRQKVYEQQLAHEAMAESNRELLERTKQLQELNRALEAKIQDRAQNLMTLQTQLIQAEKFSAIGHLAAGVAHEINNPIGFINSNLQTLRQYVMHYTKLLAILNKLEKVLKDRDMVRAGELAESWEKFRKDTNFAFIGGDVDNLLQESMEGAQKIGKIVSDLRTFASPDRGHMVSVNVETLLDSMLNIVRNEIKYKAELVREYNHVPLIVCNPQKIGQVFVNILMNAAQAIEKKGKIIVKTYAKDDFVCIDITDTGAGISPENITKIFDPLFTTKAPGQGVGLGLSLSYDIVRKHKGTICFNSKLGEGTTFTVMLPSGVQEFDTAVLWRAYERD